MDVIENVSNNQNITPISTVCEEDPQEKLFDKLVKLWVIDEISYKHLLKNYPEYEDSMIRKLLILLLNKTP